jgi:hypothetical protein
MSDESAVTLDERDAQALLTRYVEAHLESGARIDPDRLCAERPDLAPRLRALVAAYHAVESALDGGGEPASDKDGGALPDLAGFRVIERLGRGGGGDVYKVEDLTLGRIVAAKVLRRDSPLAATLPDFLREARSLALFDDPRIVRLLELRPGDPPVLLMEYVDGFTLAEIGPSLEFAQRARLLAKLAAALERAHALGLQHRDLKPANVLVDARLEPKLLDFGVSGSAPHDGHGRGTLDYMAPEQLDPRRPIDARTDVYALGVVLYELLCGARPYEGTDEATTIARLRDGRPRLPVEIDPHVPEPLQAIALMAMAVDPADRYASAREMRLDLERYLDGRPVLARPAAYRSALERRIEPHLEHIAEWERLRLVHPHEGERLRAGYRRLRAREDDWIVQSRLLSFPQIALYVGAFVLFCGSVLAFLASIEGAVKGVAWPLVALGLPCAALHLAAHRLYKGAHKATAVAFYLGAAVLIPSMLLIVFREAGWWVAPPGAERELFERVSNRQLQIASLASCLWAAVLAARTHTVALSSGFTLLLAVTHLTFLGDRGLKRWLEEQEWHHLAFSLAPLLLIVIVLGGAAERRLRTWFAEPLYVAGAALYVLVLELLALNGKAFAYLGLTLGLPAGTTVSDPALLDTVAAMTANGLLIYVAGTLLVRHGTDLQQRVASLLYGVSPFAILEPLAYLVGTGEYPRRFDWIYLGLALGVAFASRFRQRRSFYYAGLINTALALSLITDHYHWKDRPAWTVAVVVAGVTLLALGLALHWQSTSRRHPGTSIGA